MRAAVASYQAAAVSSPSAAHGEGHSPLHSTSTSTLSLHLYPWRKRSVVFKAVFTYKP